MADHADAQTFDKVHERVTLDLARGRMAGLFFDGDRRRPILFAHANGFCASAYRQVFEAMGGGHAALAVDLRGHGRSTMPADPQSHRSWDVFGADIAAAMDAAAAELGLKGPWILAGHSLGATSSILAAAGRSDIAAVRLVEPVIMPRLAGLLAGTPIWPLFARRMGLVRGALSRRATWADREAAKRHYADKSLFRDWAPGVLEDYLRNGLIDTADGVRLSCAPVWEAANFAAQGHDVWGALRRVKAPVAVLAAARGSTVPEDARRRLRKAGVALTILEGAGHLLPMARPGEVAAFLRQ